MRSRDGFTFEGLRGAANVDEYRVSTISLKSSSRESSVSPPWISSDLHHPTTLFETKQKGLLLIAFHSFRHHLPQLNLDVLGVKVR